MFHRFLNLFKSKLLLCSIRTFNKQCSFNIILKPFKPADIAVIQIFPNSIKTAIFSNIRFLQEAKLFQNGKSRINFCDFIFFYFDYLP